HRRVHVGVQLDLVGAGSTADRRGAGGGGGGDGAAEEQRAGGCHGRDAAGEGIHVRVFLVSSARMRSPGLRKASPSRGRRRRRGAAGRWLRRSRRGGGGYSCAVLPGVVGQNALAGPAQGLTIAVPVGLAEAGE